MKIITASLYAAALVSAALSPAQLCAQSAPTVASPDIVDSRPPDETKSHWLSSSLGSCEVGIYVLGEDAYATISPRPVEPDRIDLLRAALRNGLAARLNGQQIIVEHYGLYLNNAASVVGARIGGAFAGPLGALAGGTAQTVHAKCPHDKMPYGWFDTSELTTPNSPLVVQIELSVDGKSYSARAVYSQMKDEPAVHALPAAIALGNATVVGVLSKSMP